MLKNLHFWLILFPFTLSSFIALSIFIVVKFLPDRLPLFYSLPWGEKQLATDRQLLIIPTVIILVTVLNLIISWQLHLTQSFFKKSLLVSSIIVSLILTVTFIKIVLNFL